MRVLIIVILLILAIACASTSTSKLVPSTSIKDTFRIVKLDTIGNYNLVYANKNDSIYKIVSPKVKNDCNPIIVNGEYLLELRSSLLTGRVKGGKITLGTYDLVQCIEYDSTTTICFEKNCVWGLFNSPNLDGLCLRDKP